MLSFVWVVWWYGILCGTRLVVKDVWLGSSLCSLAVEWERCTKKERNAPLFLLPLWEGVRTRDARKRKKSPTVVKFAVLLHTVLLASLLSFSSAVSWQSIVDFWDMQKKITH